MRARRNSVFRPPSPRTKEVAVITAATAAPFERICGNPALALLEVGASSYEELVFPVAPFGMAHLVQTPYEAPNVWRGPFYFGRNIGGPVSAVSMISSNFGRIL